MHFTFSLKRKRMILGCVAALLTFSVCWYVSGSLIKSAVLAAAFPLFAAFDISLEKRFLPIFVAACFLISGGVALFLTQFCQGEAIASILPGRALLGLVCCMIPICILFLIYPNIRFSTLSAVGLLLVLATVNCYVYQFRGNEFSPIDLLAVGTALNVAGGYTITFSPNLTYSWVLFGAFAFGMFSIQFPTVKRTSPLSLAVAVCGLLMCGAVVLGTGQIPAHHFRNNGTICNGYILNFAISLRECYLQVPEGYSRDSVNQIIQEYTSEDNALIPDTADLPDIIVVMNESFADLRVLGDHFETSHELFPFISSLTENTVKGYALSSAYGGRTANSEYEFLTGATMAFAPQGSIAYQQFVSENSYSMVSALERLGYSSLAMHPYIEDGWMRNTVWPALGFDKCLFLDDFPQDSDMLRDYVSDAEMVEQLIAQYEQRDSDKPFFCYGVTMQNHSPFDYSGENFRETVQLEGVSAGYAEGNQYLTLLNASDLAMQTLIEYFAQVERNVIVVFYGDHLPALEPSFYEQIHGGAFDSLDEQMLQYKVPFFIWANHDIKEQHILCTSLNYLSVLVYEAAGISMPPYQQFMKELAQVIPSINMHGYYSKAEEKYLPVSQAQGVEAEWLNRYHQLQYAYMSGEGNSALYGSAEK